MSEVSVIGLDLAKHVFQVHGADASGRAVIRTCSSVGFVASYGPSNVRRGNAGCP